MRKISSEEILKIDAALARVRNELIRATELHAPMRSAHEGYGVIAEEWREFEDAIRSNSKEDRLKEVTQVAAMATRFVVDADTFT